jgi:hypothetical protein
LTTARPVLPVAPMTANISWFLAQSKRVSFLKIHFSGVNQPRTVLWLDAPTQACWVGEIREVA